jgi:uncharacterized protein (TIGR02246 family)
MRSIRLLVLAGVVIVAPSLVAQAPVAIEEAAVKAVLTRMIDAFNAADFSAVASTYTANGTMIVGDGTQHTGRAAIERFFVDMRTSLPTYTRFHARITGVRFVTPDVAVLLSEGGFMIPGETDVAPERFGLQSVIAVREGGSWSAVLVQRTRIPPPRPAR